MDNWKDSFVDYFENISSGEEKTLDGDFLGQAVCPFCGRVQDIRHMMSDSLAGFLCVECQNSQVKSIERYQEMAKEIKKKLEYLFGFQLDKNVVVKEIKDSRRKRDSRMDKKAVGEQDITDKFCSLLQDREVNGKVWVKKGKENTLCIRKGLPEGNAVAEIVFFILGCKISTEDSGLKKWFTVRYLYMIGEGRLAEEYNRMWSLEDTSDSNRYGEWIRELGSPLGEQIVLYEEALLKRKVSKNPEVVSVKTCEEEKSQPSTDDPNK